MRRYCARWTAAEAVLAVAWAAAAIGLLADALVRDSLGSGAIAAFAAWQLSHVWSQVHRRDVLAPAEDRRALRRPR
jgi:Protein of unknown function (DUF3318)